MLCAGEDLKHYVTPVGVPICVMESSMIWKRIGLVIVVVAVAAIIVVKAGSARTTSTPAQPAVTATASAPAVVLVADLREADSDCGCGQLIRRVRAAKAKGVAVEEVTPDNAEAARRYGFTVVPTVVILGKDGKVVARHEGELGYTLAQIDADLTKLEGARR